jgi:hypothetical protein
LFRNAFRILDTDAVSKLKKLAILLDPETDVSLGKWVGKFVRGFGNMCFDNVETITLALKHYQEDEDDQTNPIIMDKPINFQKARATYK